MLKVLNTMKEGGAQITAERALTEALKDVPFLKDLRFRREARLGRAQVDLLVTVRAREKVQRLVCELKSSGQPRIAREACLQLLHWIGGTDAYAVFIAPFVSTEAGSICTEMGVGFIDFSGNCRLSFDGIYVQRSGYPNPSAKRRELRSLYSPKAERVLRALVTGGPRRWRTQELADEAKVSLGQVANVKRLLADREWIDLGDRGFGLRPFDSAVRPLIEEWSVNYRLNRSASSEFYSIKSVAETEASLVANAHELGGDLGFTGFSGAARVHPVVRYQRITAYYLGDPELLAERSGLKRVNSGANVTVLSPYDEGVLYGVRQIDQAPTVSPMQLYLDLRQTKGRGEEAATAILDEVIAPIWR